MSENTVQDEEKIEQESAEEADTAAESTESEAAAESEAAEDNPPEKSAEDLLKEENEKLKAELAAQQDKYLRLDAEYYNYRTRSLKEKQDAHDEAIIKTMTEILPVIDNFERAVAAQTEDVTYKKGVEMILRQYMDILAKLGIEEIKAEGEPFDPNLHNAVTQVTDESLGDNVVAQVLQKGYTLDKKVLRHAMVCVANP
ncbi:MAG: nucleotide exchange factor GrpE [Oscillospiraceae bacterium]|nr:nucleotide exchange factor GrpE [Oscillospiraceae bacterium]